MKANKSLEINYLTIPRMVRLLHFLVAYLIFVCVQSFFPFAKPAEKDVEIGTILIRGVRHYDQDKYSQETFTCDGNTKSYTKLEVNDGYCDCVDGSDEPGTSACQGNTFHCANKGYRITQIPSSRVDDGVCDCCDGSDEGNIVKCQNVCVAAAAKEKQMIEKVTAAYKVGSVIRSKDIARIEKSKADLILNVEPLKVSTLELKVELESLLALKKNGEILNAEISDRASDSVKANAGNLLDLHNMPDFHIARVLSTLFSLMEMTDSDVKNSLIVAGMNPFIGSESSNEQSINDDGDSDEGGDIDSQGDGADEVADDYHTSGHEEVENRERNDPLLNGDGENLETKEMSDRTEEVPANDEPFHCTLLHHVKDPRLRFLCNHKPLGEITDENLPSEHDTATSTAVENGRSLVLHLLKTRELYTEMQLLMGYYRVRGTLEGAVDFIKTHKETEDPHSCPADWAGTEFAEDICTLNEKLFELYDSLNFLDGKSPDAEIDLTDKQATLRSKEEELAKSERELEEFDNYSDYLEYLALKEKCFDGKDGKFTYSVCILDKLTQSDSENEGGGEVTLGTFSSIESNPDTGGIIMHFTEGTHCWAFGARTADVFITCGPEQKMISSNEPTTCYYKFEVESPSGCTEEFAQINGIL